MIKICPIYKESKSLIPVCNIETYTLDKNTNNRMQHKYKIISVWIKEFQVNQKCTTCGNVTDIVAKNITLK